MSRAALAAAATLLCVPPAAAHEMKCWPRERVLQIAGEYLDQRPAFVAVVDSGRLLEILASPDGGFTAGLVYPDGRFCIFADGEGWRPAPAPAPVAAGEEG